MASWGLDSRWGRRGSGVAVVMVTELASPAWAVSSTPSRILGLGLACAAAVSEAATSAAVIAVPSWNPTPSRRVKFQDAGPVCCHSVASAGCASPSSSSSTSVSAVFQRDSLNASSLSGDKPDRGGWSMASLIRPESVPGPAAWSFPAAKHPVRLVARSSTDRPVSAGRRRGLDMGEYLFLQLGCLNAVLPGVGACAKSRQVTFWWAGAGGVRRREAP